MTQRYPTFLGDPPPDRDWTRAEVFARKPRLVQWLYFKLTGWRVVAIRGDNQLLGYEWTDRRPGRVRLKERS